MVKIEPERLDLIEYDIPNGEKKLYEMCSGLPDPWMVWYSRHWMDEKKKGISYGEVDFLVFHPNHGFLVLEVKGGGISRMNGTWYTENKNGKFKLKRSPFEQAERSMHYYDNHYIDCAKDLIKEDRYKYSALLEKNQYFPGCKGIGVIFPDCYFKREAYLSGSYENYNLVFDLDDVKIFENGKETHFENYLNNLFDYHRQNRHDFIPDIVAELFPEFISNNLNINMPLKIWLTKREEKLEEVNERQDFLLRTLSKKRKCIFEGSAGTGKTFIALKKIKYEFFQGDLKNSLRKQILFLCFNKQLIEFITKSLEDDYKKILTPQFLQENNLRENELGGISPFSIDKLVKILMENFVKSIDSTKYDEYLDIIWNRSTSENYSKISGWICELLETDLVKKDFKYDIVLVDEAQDIREEYYPILEHFLKSAKSVFWIFYDPSQTIFENNSTFFQNLGFDLFQDRIILDKNLRNADSIVEWYIKKSGKGKYFELSHIGKGKILNIEAISLYNCFSQIQKKILEFKNQSINLERITVLSDQKLQYLTKQFPNEIRKIELSGIQSYIFEIKSVIKSAESIEFIEPEKNLELRRKLKGKRKNWVLYNGIGTFKGLESDIVFLLVNNLNKPKKESLLKRLYVGASRAKFILVLCNYKNKFY